MADQFLAEIRFVGFNFAPKGWAFCDGQVLPISQNTALFSLLGTTYGGNGTSTFALPNLQGSQAIGAGQGPGLSLRDLGETSGETTVTLTPSELPAHTHTLSPQASDDARTTDQPASAYPSRGGIYATNADSASPMGPSQTSDGPAQPHNNLQPYLTLNAVIALTGIYPARS